MNTLKCIIVKRDGFERIQMPEDLALQLMKTLQDKESETIHLHEGKTIVAYGIYVAGRDSKISLLHINEEENNE